MRNFLLFILLGLFATACIEDKLILPEAVDVEDKGDGTDRPPVKPDYIQVISDYDGVIRLHWPEIDSERIKAISISYMKDGEDQQLEVTDFSDDLILDDLEIGQEYEFIFTAIGIDGQVSKDYKITASPKPLAVNVVYESLSVNPFSFGDIAVRWFNSTGHEVSINVRLAEDSYNSELSDTTSGLFFIEDIERAEYMLEVAVTDDAGNQSPRKIYPVKVVSELLAVTDGWIATANSEHHPGENTGLASALIDGDLNTIWHTRWDAGAPSYPHWAQFDMISSSLVSKISMAARQNNTMGMTKFRIEGSMDGIKWFTIIDDQSFDPENKEYQEYTFEPVDARYLKLVAIEGKAFYTHLAEFRVYIYE
ncbi:discoidin domain-containing protein [Albibacterium profundi]|uniref:Discoidin domain-containing protein n=1 Tax=Albibacterium profundi TaxID=3134906 RepID=A0ABV5CCF2_9SPHI